MFDVDCPVPLLVASQSIRNKASTLNQNFRMDWRFKSISRTSTLSESAFQDGEQVVCLIYKNRDNGEIGRADIRPEELDGFKFPGELLGRWRHVIRKSEDATATARERVASAEDFFFSLYETSDQTGNCEKTNALKHLLALMLERKRIVRVQGKRKHEGAQTYLHIRTKRMLDVPIVAISADLIIRIQETIGDILSS